VIDEDNALALRLLFSVFVDLQVLRQLSEPLQLMDFVGIELVDDVRLPILEVPKTDKHDIHRVDPDPSPHLPANSAHALDAIETLRFETPIAQHFGDLGIFLFRLFDEKLALGDVLVLSATPVLATLAFVLGHVINEWLVRKGLRVGLSGLR
jgi:hypothetical protein